MTGTAPLAWSVTAEGAHYAEIDDGEATYPDGDDIDIFEITLTAAQNGGWHIHVEHYSRGGAFVNFCEGTLEEAKAEAEKEARAFIERWNED